jgi:hypothetical protein
MNWLRATAEHVTVTSPPNLVVVNHNPNYLIVGTGDYWRKEALNQILSECSIDEYNIYLQDQDWSDLDLPWLTTHQTLSSKILVHIDTLETMTIDAAVWFTRLASDTKVYMSINHSLNCRFRRQFEGWSTNLICGSLKENISRMLGSPEIVDK